MNRYYSVVPLQTSTHKHTYATCREASEILKVHLTTVQRLTKNGTIPSIKVGKSVRIPLSWLTARGEAAGK